MVDTSPAEIARAISQHNLKEARASLDVALSKSPRSAVLRGLNALLYRNENEKAKSLAAAHSVFDSTASVADFSAVRALIEPVALVYGETDLLVSAYEKCARRGVVSQESVGIWTQAMLSCGSWWGLSRALIAANKCQPNAAALYRMAFSFVMAHAQMDKADPRAGLLAPMALKFIEKAPAPSTPQRAYAKACVICCASGPLAAAEYAQSAECETLQSLDLNVSTLGWLVQTEQWDKVWHWCTARLPTHDSFDHWQALVKAAVKGSRVRELDAFFANYTGHNVSLARVELALALEEDPAGALISFWTEFSEKPSAFAFVKHYLSKAGPSFVQQVNNLEPKTAIGAANKAKLQTLAGQQLKVGTLVSLYQQFLFEKPSNHTDYFAGTDLLLLAATQILKSDSDTRREEAAVLLEMALEADPSHFQVKILLVYIYRSLAALSLAQKHFDDLTLKNMQLETIAPVLLPRGGSLGLPAQILSWLKTNSKRQERECFRGASGALEHEIYTQLPGILELKRRLACSLPRNLLASEVVRSMRLQRAQTNVAEVLQAPGADKLIDLRDSSCEFDILGEFAGGFDGWKIRTGPWQTSKYAAAAQQREVDLLRAMRGESDLQLFAELDDETAAEHTSPELQALAALRAANLAVSGSGTVADVALELTAVLGDKTLNDWRGLHAVYTTLETAKLIGDLGAKLKIPALSETAVLGRKAAREVVDSAQFTVVKVDASHTSAELSTKITTQIAESQANALASLRSVLR